MGNTAGGTDASAPDVITALLPPVSPTYQDQLAQWAKDFEIANPNLTLLINKAGWEDITGTLNAMINAGAPPDIAFIGSGGIYKYLSAGILTDITGLMTPEMKSDYNAGALAYFKNKDGLYGLPAYMNAQSIGGDRYQLEAAGVDWKSVQKNGWTYDRFREAIKAGNVTADGKTAYGFVFACDGVTAMDYLSIFSKCAGMPGPFTADLKYAYTGKNMLKLLTDMRQMIDDGSMPDNLDTIDSGARWDMFLKGRVMIIGKGLPIFENLAAQNNAEMDAGGSVPGSVKTEYIVLPAPAFFGCEQRTQVAVDGYVCLKADSAVSKHQADAVKAMYFLGSGERAAYADMELFCDSVCKSAAAVYRQPAGRSEDNANAAKLLISRAAPPNPDIPAGLYAKSDEITHNTIIPMFQRMLAGKASPREVYDAIVTAAVAAFGEDGILKE